jgi:hypothetical protein
MESTKGSYRGPPPYLLRIASKANPKHRTIAGAIFPVNFGQFNIVLNPGVVLSWTDDVWVTLVPTKDAEREPLDPGRAADDVNNEPAGGGGGDEFPF